MSSNNDSVFLSKYPGCKDPTTASSTTQSIKFSTRSSSIKEAAIAFTITSGSKLIITGTNLLPTITTGRPGAYNIYSGDTCSSKTAGTLSSEKFNYSINSTKTQAEFTTSESGTYTLFYSIGVNETDIPANEQVYLQ